MKHIDSIRLERLSDPQFKFCFSISADGFCNVREPMLATYLNLRSAIDAARCKAGEHPYCLKCHHPLNESDTDQKDMEAIGIAQGLTVPKYTCPQCKTSFYP